MLELLYFPYLNETNIKCKTFYYNTVWLYKNKPKGTVSEKAPPTIFMNLNKLRTDM